MTSQYILSSYFFHYISVIELITMKSNYVFFLTDVQNPFGSAINTSTRSGGKFITCIELGSKKIEKKNIAIKNRNTQKTIISTNYTFFFQIFRALQHLFPQSLEILNKNFLVWFLYRSWNYWLVIPLRLLFSLFTHSDIFNTKKHR